MPGPRHMLRGSLVYLRGFEPSDAELYARWRRDPVPMAQTGYPWPGPISDAAGETAMVTRLIEAQGKPDWHFLACRLEDDRPLGEVMLMHIDALNRTAEFGIFIGDPTDWGQGYGTDALNATCDFGFGELDLVRIELMTRADNAPGLRSYAKGGFSVEGTRRAAVHRHGERVDIVVMGLLREEWQQLPRKKSWEYT